jgi:hypothetical protein
MNIFQGAPQDIYVHWLILVLGIGILVSGIAVITTCRNVAGFFHLLKTGDSLKTKVYKGCFRFHSYYWVAFLLFLLLHLMATVFHVGLPSVGEPYHLAHQVVFYTAFVNFILSLVVFCSCRSFLSLIGIFSARNPLSGGFFKRFYSWHSVLWVILGFSFVAHITAGIIHAVNT